MDITEEMIKEIICESLNITYSSIPEDLEYGSIPEWDSFNTLF